MSKPKHSYVTLSRQKLETLIKLSKTGYKSKQLNVRKNLSRAKEQNGYEINLGKWIELVGKMASVILKDFSGSLVIVSAAEFLLVILLRFAKRKKELWNTDITVGDADGWFAIYAQNSM